MQVLAAGGISMRVAALICRSYYSLLRGPLSVQQIIAAAKDYGYNHVALADVNAMYGLVDFAETAKKYDIRPIIGVDILTENSRAFLLAENDDGYKNLCRITTARNLDSDFDLVKQLADNNKGLICISIQRPLLKVLQDILPRGNLFAGCQNARQQDHVVDEGFEPVAFNTFNIIDNSDTTTAKLLARIRRLSVAGPGPEDNVGFVKLQPKEQFVNNFGPGSRAVVNNIEIGQRCRFELLADRLYLPKALLPRGKNAQAELSRLAHLGLAKRYPRVNREIIKRLEYELAVINNLRFSDYFFVVKQIVDFAKRSNIPVDVRGSAAGSLVSYVLGFTRVCPMENRLYFERFMNPGRRDCPDIDIDLCWRRRDEVIKFCYENWGSDRVAMICNINRYRLRSAIRDTGRALGLSPKQIDELIRKRHSLPDCAVSRLAGTLIGTPRHIGLHCGGIVIAPEPIWNLAPLELATKGVVVTQYDKDAAEPCGLIKIDILGNRSLSTINEAVVYLSSAGVGVDIDQLDPNDEKTARLLSAGNSLGVFQCESPGMRQLLRALKVRNKNDVAIALSLIRPGPAAGGTKAEFIERHVNKKPFAYLHPKMKEIFEDTHGVMLYQEDIMKIATEIAGYSVAEAARFRSEVSKKVSPTKLQSQYEEFVYRKADAVGLDRRTAEAMWDDVLRFAAYSYCRAHAAVYANIAWQSAYLKAHFPRQFYCSLLNNHQGMYPLRVYVWDAIRSGIRILPPHVNKSGLEWSLEGNSIRAGLNIVSHLSYRTAETIITERSKKVFTDLDDLRRRVRFARPELQNLVHVGACDGLANTRVAMLMQLHYQPPAAGQLILLEILPNPTKAQLPDYDRFARLNAELDVTGIPFTMHPELLIRGPHVLARALPRYVNKDVKVCGFIATARTARTSDGKTMGFVTIEDSTGLAEVTFFPDQLELYRKTCSLSGPVTVTGKVTEHLCSINIEAQSCSNVA
jgi:DNA-directed DNA polymerase III PolC